MGYFGIVMTLFSILFLAMLGVYGWTWKVAKDSHDRYIEITTNVAKQLSKIYETVNGHLQSASIHVDKKEFVSADVCKVVHENIDKKMDEIGKDVKCLLAKA